MYKYLSIYLSIYPLFTYSILNIITYHIYLILEDMPEGRVPCRGLCMFMRLEAMLKEMKEMAAAATNKEKVLERQIDR